MFQKILLATDGSSASQQAADYAAALAVRFNAKVIALHAFNQLVVPPVGYSFPNVDAYASYQDAEKLVAQTAERLRSQGVGEVEEQVVQGQAVHVILGAAETIKPDVIVMGARGVGTWQGLLLGSTSMSVVQRAQVPVLVVK